MQLFTIGFTQKSAEAFFGFIRQAGVKTLIDVRLNNNSQLAGFAKQTDLKYFLRELCAVDYRHELTLAPTKAMLNAYKKGDISWQAYADSFLDLMAQRNIERQFTAEELAYGCLLCSEHKPHHCHRTLVVEYLNATTDLNLQVKHLF